MSLAYLEQIGKAKESVKQLADTPLGQAAASFANMAISDMKENVPTSQPGTGALKQSLGVEFEANGETLSIKFLADDYWDYVNSGVNGKLKSSGALINQFGSTYSFKTVNPSKKMVDAFAGVGGMQNWLAGKGITSLRYGGKTHPLRTNKDYRGAAYVFARAVKKKGIKPSGFVNEAFSEEKMKAFEEALLDAWEDII
jgi:hypothetical protein